MPLFQTKIPINQEEVSKLVLEKWGIKIQKVLKASQNHTYMGTYQSENSTVSKCSIRITPDPENKHFQRIKDELFYVNYCVENKLLHICAPIPTRGQNKQLYLKNGDLIISVFEWARGEPVNFFQLKWIKDIQLMKAWGQFFAQMHQISKKFSKQHPEVAKRIQNWNQIHHGVLKKIKLDQADQTDVENPQCFGVIHGDLNTSNYYYNRQSDYISVYDTDQTQKGFYQWDMAQAIFGVVMLQQAGMPISGTPVPEADRNLFEENLIKGYESVAGQNAINRARLARMVDMKRQFYRLFCTQAIEEGDIPKDMQAFIVFCAKTFNRLKEQRQKKAQQSAKPKQKQNQN